MDIEKIHNLTPLQGGMLHHALMDMSSPVYHEQVSMQINGDIDLDIIEKSLNIQLEKHEALRAVFIYERVNKPIQVILKSREVKIDFQDISSMTQEGKIRYLDEYTAGDKRRRFDLSKDILMRMAVLKESEDTYRLIWSFHHIIMDGWSMGIFINEFFETYNTLKMGMKVDDKEKFPYSSYIQWLQGLRKKEAITYWVEYLEGYGEKVSVPKEKVRNETGGYVQKEVNFAINQSKTEKLMKVGNNYQVTLNTVMQAIWGILLQKYNNTDDVVYGTIVSGRSPELAGVESTIGLFINTIPVRVKCTAKSKFSDIISDLQKTNLISENYSHHPLVEIQSNTQIKRELLDHLFVFENYPLTKSINDTTSVAKLKVKNIKVFEQTSYDFNLLIAPGESINIVLKYNANVYEKKFIKSIEGHINKIVECVIENSDICMEDIEICTEEEKKCIFNEFNNTRVEYPEEKCIHELFEEQVRLTPKKRAIVHSKRSITYDELNQKSNKIARYIKKNDIKADDIIGIIADQSIELIIGILGIMKSGSAFLPIDPSYPQDRIEYMLQNSNAKMSLTQEMLSEILNQSSELYNSDNLECINTINDLVYVIYTSGSTGNPKGVMVEHKAVANLCAWHKNFYKITDKDRATKYAGIGFDASVWEILPYLLSGAELHIIEEDIKLDMEKLSKYYEKNDMTISFLPTQVCELYMLHGKVHLKQLLTGGDKLNRYVNGSYRLVNNYGPTENTVVATNCVVDKDYSNIPIGKPIDNTMVYILDKYLKLQPPGVPGELCISGRNLARGYINDSEMTAEKFIENPFSAGEKMYRTGDLGRWLPDGNIEFMGRMDSQVKIRGFRIELGEIEAALLKHEEVKAAAVTSHEEDDVNKYLCGYLVSERDLGIQELREHLSELLPEYMIPQSFMRIENLPLNKSGKVDRKMLPKPEDSINTQTEYMAPRNEVEENLAKIWEEVLGVERVGINDNFFELGGESIKAIQVSARLQRYELRVDTKDLLMYPRINQLVNHVKNQERKVPQGIVEGEVKLTPIQSWYFDKQLTEEQYFNQAFMLYKEDGFEEEAVRKTWDKIVEHHDALRLVFTKEDGKVIQQNRGLDGLGYDMEILDLSGEADYIELIEKRDNEIQKSMDLGKGPLVKMCLFKTDNGDHLLIAIHHLVVDGVSWRIIFEDFAMGYRQIIDNKAVELPAKTNSYKDWSNGISEYMKDIKDEREYWERICSMPVSKLPHNQASYSNKVKYSQNYSLTLTEDETEKLLKKVNKAYNTEINDILLTALGITMKEWTGEDKILINMEGHGREEINKKLDVSRTVGWFTSIYPVVLDMEKSEELSYQIKLIKETLRSIPKKGIGYGCLRYLSNSSGKLIINPEVSFNYMGQVEQDIQNDVFCISDISAGQQVGGENENISKLEFNCIVIKKKLHISLTFSNGYSSDKMYKVICDFVHNLKKLIIHCIEKEQVEITPSDMFYAEFSIDEFESLEKDLLDLYE